MSVVGHGGGVAVGIVDGCVGWFGDLRWWHRLDHRSRCSPGSLAQSPTGTASYRLDGGSFCPGSAIMITSFLFCCSAVHPAAHAAKRFRCEIAMVPFTITYDGSLRCSATHGPSGISLTTDAPKDNHGRGESFSPTDLTATSLATCMITTMAIQTRTENLPLAGLRADVEKHMTATSPRRLARIVVRLHMPRGIAVVTRERLKTIAHGCPVALSLHPEVVQDVSFIYPD
jgi:putative redox protein